MFVLRNISDEDLEIISSVDPDVEGCNLKPGETSSIILPPNETICGLGYHPGMLMAIRPKKNPEIIRGYNDWRENDESIARSKRWTDRRLDRKSGDIGTKGSS